MGHDHERTPADDHAWDGSRVVIVFVVLLVLLVLVMVLVRAEGGEDVDHEDAAASSRVIGG